jgi:haloalkane dehalogenase
VVCIHGVPASAFLYRKLVPELARRELRGIAFDLPGLGLAERPGDFDYPWTGLGRWTVAAVDALGLDRLHLVVHDIGGPIGFELAAQIPKRLVSLTILSTFVEVDTFRRPWSMQPFAIRGLGPAYLNSLTKPAFRTLMRLQGIADPGGAAFLKIMRGFELTRAKRDLYVDVLGRGPFPIQVIWGERDPALKITRHGEAIRTAAGVPDIIRLPGKHFLQEDQAPAIAEHIASFVAR